MRAGTHVIGAGLAGLAAAVALARAGHGVTVYEAGSRAGGRCRSYFDARLGSAIDNGNHLLLTGNRAAMRYLADIEAAGELTGPASARFPFLDVRTGERWTLRPNAGRVPWWILDPDRRVPGTKASGYLSALRLAFAGTDRTVTDCVGARGRVFERFWEPLAVAALNTPARTGAACLLWPVVRETFARGESACRPRVARTGLSRTFVDPALALLNRRGAKVRFGCRLRGIACRGRRAKELDFGAETVALQRGESVVLAVPPAAAGGLVPELRVPAKSQAIVNAHFRLSGPAGLPAELPFLGLVGATAQWLFVRGEVASITISAAEEIAAEPAEAIARKTWNDAAFALGRDPSPLPPYRVIKERRATFSQTPEEVRRRPGTRTALENLFLAGDWIDTGLPATIEGAIRAGHLAARAIAGRGSVDPAGSGGG